MKPHKTAAQMRASRAAVIRSTLQLYLLAAVAWSAPRALPWSLHGARNGTQSSFACDTQRKGQTNETDEIDETDETDERDCETDDSRGQPRCKGRGWVGGCRELRSGAAGPGGRGTQSGEAVERAGEREAGAGGGVAADTLKLS